MNSSDNLKRQLGDVELYHDVDVVYKELQELGYSRTDKLDVEKLSKVDQLHYFGAEAVDHAIKSLAVGPNHKILDVGSGLGGPARCIANATKCHVTAIELQERYHNAACDLTARCGLDGYITHRCEDFLGLNGPDFNTYDFLFGWLVFVHIGDKKNLFQTCYSTLKSGGKFYAEDFWIKRQWTKEEEESIQKHIYCPQLQTYDGWREDLSQAGFTDIQMTDMTREWTAFTQARYDAYMENRERHVRVQGEDTTQALETFYSIISESFGRGLFGGVRIVATKP